MYASLGQSGSLFIDLAINGDDQIHSSSFSACSASVSGGGLFISSTGRSNTLEVKNAAFDSSCNAPEGRYIMIECVDISSLLEGKIDNWEGTIDNNGMREKEQFWVREKTDGVETLSISLIDYFYPSVPSVQSSDLSSSQQTEPSSSQSSRQSRSESSSSSFSLSHPMIAIIAVLALALFGVLVCLFCCRRCRRAKPAESDHSAQALGEDDRRISEMPLILEEEDTITTHDSLSSMSTDSTPSQFTTHDSMTEIDRDDEEEENTDLQTAFSEEADKALTEYS